MATGGRTNLFELFGVPYVGNVDVEVLQGEDSDWDGNLEESDEESEELDISQGVSRGSDSDSDSESDTGSTDEDGWRLIHGEELNEGRPELVFRGTPGISADSTARLGENPSPIDFTQLFVSAEDYEEMAVETNRYAASFLEGANLPPHSRLAKWTPTNAEEMKAFLSLTISMGLIVQEELADYWSTDEVLSTPFFPSVMPRDRFLNIMSFCHLSDNSRYVQRGRPGYKPLQKLGNIYDHVISRFRTVWTPGQNIGIDEGMVPFRGKIHFRVYAPDKPHKYGIKIYQLCDSDNGYCSEFMPYTGKSDEEPSEHGKTYDIVKCLIAPYENCGRILYIDNYYTSPVLFENLLLVNTGATGTARQRRGMPLRFKEKIGQVKIRGEKIVMKKESLLACRIKDSKQVTFLSTVHSARVDLSQTQPVGGPAAQPNGGQAVVPVGGPAGEPVGGPAVEPVAIEQAGGRVRRLRPEVMNQYNLNMGAVDRSDQMVGYSSFRRRSLKWWKKLFFHLFSLTLLNAYIVYKEFSKSKGMTAMKHKTFRKVVAKELIVGFPRLQNSRKGRRSNSMENITRLTERHYPSRIQGSGIRANIARVCLVCSETERRKLRVQGVAKKRAGRETRFECKKCTVSLCVEPCFEIYHEYADYVREAQRRQSTV